MISWVKVPHLQPRAHRHRLTTEHQVKCILFPLVTITRHYTMTITLSIRSSLGDRGEEILEERGREKGTQYVLRLAVSSLRLSLFFFLPEMPDTQAISLKTFALCFEGNTSSGLLRTVCGLHGDVPLDRTGYGF